MIDNPQTVCKIIGAEGCYELSLFKAAVDHGAGDDLDILKWHMKFIQSGYLGSDCFVHKPAKILGALIGGTWQLLKAGNGKDSSGRDYDLPLDYICTTGEIEILRFERKEGMSTVAHFVCGDGKGNVTWDPYLDSKTVREGYLVSKRIFRR